MLDADTAGLIADAFDLGDGAVLSSGPVARGEQGQVWQLTTSTGPWAVKESFRPVDPAELTAAADFAAAAAALGVFSPTSRRDRDGHLSRSIGSASVQVGQWVDLLPPDPLLDPRAVGRALAGIHRTRLPAIGPDDPWFSDPVGAEEWEDLERRLVDAEAPFAADFARLRPEFAALDEWVRPPAELWTCHRDLWADNLRQTVTGEVCVIDWQDCGPADPTYELACLLVEFAGEQPKRVAALHESYVDSGGPARVRGRADFSMLIAQLGHICRIACRDWLDPAARSTDREHSAARFTEFVERPYSRASLDAILQALD